MAKNIFTKSDKFKQEYSISIVRLGEVKDINGYDAIGSTIVDNYSMVVRKDECHEGDILFYASNESELAQEFLSKNNLFEIGERQLNANYEEVEKLMNEDKKDEAKRMVGFFNKYGRVKMIRLGGVPSYGFLFSQKAMAEFAPEVADINLEDYVGTEFDTVSGNLFCKAYVPRIKEHRSGGGKGRHYKRHKKTIEKIDRIVEGQWAFHYDTMSLEKNAHRINPDDIVDISVKMDGTSIIFGNVQVRAPRLYKTKFNWINKLIFKVFTLMPEKWRHWDIDWDDVCSSRNVIRSKNAYVTEPQSTTSMVGKEGDNYPKGLDAVYPQWEAILKGTIPHGTIIYGEVLGYVPSAVTDEKGKETYAGIITRGGKVYDYGCKHGENKLMIYRVTEMNPETGRYEDFEITDVIGFTNWLIETYPHLTDKIMPFPLLYHGPAKDIYPDLSTEDHWHQNLVMKMKGDSEKFGMDKNEPFCKNKVVREGLVIRIENDPIQEAFKVKCDKYWEQEKKDMDKGLITGDMLEGYGDDEE